MVQNFKVLQSLFSSYSVEMEFISDITTCIKELQNTETKEEIELANGLQSYINDFINQYNSSLYNVNKTLEEDIMVEDGTMVEDGEIFEEEGEIIIKDTIITSNEVNQPNKLCFNDFKPSITTPERELGEKKLKNVSSRDCKDKLSTLSPERKPKIIFLSAQIDDSSYVEFKVSHQLLNCKFCPFKQTINTHIYRDFRQHIRDSHFLCEICEIRYNDKYDLIEHCESHQTKDSKYACNYEGCTYKKKKVSDVFFHAQNDHHGAQYFKCDQCNKPFTFLNNLSNHIKSHNRRKYYVCPICQVSYTSLPHIKAHFKEKHYNTCNICQTVYNNVRCFIKHLTRDTNACQKRKKRNDKYFNAAFRCMECEIRFPQKKNLTDHKKKEHSFTSVRPTNHEELDKTISSMILGEPGKYTCKGCGKNKNNRRHIIDHIETNHIDGVSHPCKLCKKNLRSRHSLRIHVFRIHK